MAWNPRQWWSQRRQELEKSGTGGAGCQRCMQPFMIPSVKEVAEATLDNILHHERHHSANQDEEDRLAKARACTDANRRLVQGKEMILTPASWKDRVRSILHLEGVKAGLKAGSIAGVASAIPTLVAVRVSPWAKRNLNYVAQALIISSATIATYFITTEQTILACSREASYARIAKEREAKGV